MDVSWSRFDSTIVVATHDHVVVETTYHNRSDNRSRDVRLDVDWQALKSADSQIALPPAAPTMPSRSFTAELPRVLVDDVLWSIAHEGCDVFTGDQMRPLPDLQKCYSSTQQGAEASSLIETASLDTIKIATLRALARSYDEYQIPANFDWVMDHEGERSTFVALAQRNSYSEIRSIYKALQAHNDKAANALSALSDRQIADLINGRDVIGEQANSDRLSAEQAVALTDSIEWAILYGGCPAFSGESLLASRLLRNCFSQFQRGNHNGEVLELINTASADDATLAVERAITKIKEQYPIGQLLNHFLVNSGELDHFKSLVKERKFEEARQVYAKKRLATPPYFLFALSPSDIAKAAALRRSANPPYLLSALANSEIAAIVNQYRLDVQIPADASVQSLESIAALVDTQKVTLTPTTTDTQLANVACGRVAFDILVFHFEASKSCVALVQRAAAKQGLKITASGTLTGGDSIQLPNLPRIGVPTLVAFKADVSANVAEATLSSSGAKFARPQPARLIEPEHGTKLSADTVSNYGDHGLQWYASAIGADRIRNSDLSLTSVVRVGIVDAGVDTTHAQLEPFFWKLPMTFPDVPWQKGSIGYDYINEISDPSEDKTPDPDGNLESHGTHVAGLVTARALASWLTAIRTLNLEEHIKVYSLKIATGADGTIPDFTYPGQALTDSLPNQIHLINLSLEGPRAPYIRDDIIAKHSSDTLLILAAGNDQKDLNDQVNLHFNGTFRNDDGTPLSNVLIVGALMEDGSLTPDSNRGDLAVQIAAPGNNIYSTVQGGGFGAITGTSQAAPLVTSTAAILLAEHDAYPATIKDRILATCDWNDELKNAHLVAEGCKLNMAKATVSQTDIIELVPRSKGVVPEWLRGTVKRDQFQFNDDHGQAIDPSQLERIWLSDRNGNVRVAVQGGGHKPSRLQLGKIVIALDAGEHCPTASNPCEVDSKEVQDIVFRWRGQQ
jgi:subtilisin family serine protease